MQKILEIAAQDYHDFESHLQLLDLIFGKGVWKYIEIGCDGKYHAIFYHNDLSLNEKSKFMAAYGAADQLFIEEGLKTGGVYLHI